MSSKHFGHLSWPLSEWLRFSSAVRNVGRSRRSALPTGKIAFWMSLIVFCAIHIEAQQPTLNVNLTPTNDAMSILVGLESPDAANFWSIVYSNSYGNPTYYYEATNYADSIFAQQTNSPNSGTLGINITKLPPPQISPDGGYFNYATNVTITLGLENLTNMVMGIFETELGQMEPPGYWTTYAENLRIQGYTDEAIRSNLIATVRASTEYQQEFGAPGDPYVADTNYIIEYSFQDGGNWITYTNPFAMASNVTVSARVRKAASTDNRTEYAYLTSDPTIVQFEYLPTNWLVSNFGAGYQMITTNIPLVDASFESPAGAQGTVAGLPSGWLFANYNPYGVFNPYAGLYTNVVNDILPAPADGSQVLWIQSINYLAQFLTNTLLPNQTYTLSGAIGNRNDMYGIQLSTDQEYVYLLAGGTILACNVNLPHPEPGGFLPWSISYTNPASGFPDGPLEIRLGQIGAGQVHFDNLSLTASYPNTNSAPNADPEGDGISNLEAYELGLNPNIFNNIRLAHFPFDDTHSWMGENGQVPLIANNVSGTVGVIGNAVRVDCPSAAILQYHDVETNGMANILCSQGSVRFWFKPDWTSSTAGGAGPGSAGRLIELGQYETNLTTGWWALYLDAGGNNLLFATASNGVVVTNVSANISWTSNQWYQVVLTYSPTNTILYTNLCAAASGTGVAYYPNAADRSAGIRIGSDSTGNNQAHGTFDELETFNYPLCTNEINWPAYQLETVTPLVGGGTPQLIWGIYNGEDIIGFGYLNPFQTPSLTIVPTCAPEPIISGEFVSISGQVYATSPIGYYQLQDPLNPDLISFAYFYVTPTVSPVYWSSTPNNSTSPVSGSTPANPSFAFSFTGYKSADVEISVGGDLNPPLFGTLVASADVLVETLPSERLAYWSFDYGYTGDGGQAAVTTTGVSLTPSPFGVSNPSFLSHGVYFSSPGNVVDLEYAAFQPDTAPEITSSGTPNIRRNRGTVRFWFKPDWSAGSGPVNGVTLVDWMAGGMKLIVPPVPTGSPGGLGIELECNGSGVLYQPFSIANWVNWTAGTWHQIVVTYSTSETVLYLDGYPLTYNATSPVPADPCAFGGNFRIGSDGGMGTQQAAGVFDELETFNYELSASDILANYTSTSALIPPSVTSGSGPPLNPNGTPPVIQLITPINAVSY